jgi:hypothetical protein
MNVKNRPCAWDTQGWEAPAKICVSHEAANQGALHGTRGKHRDGPTSQEQRQREGNNRKRQTRDLRTFVTPAG